MGTLHPHMDEGSLVQETGLFQGGPSRFPRTITGLETIYRCCIPTKVDTSDEKMHHKFAIFDGEEMISGSYNWTRSAADSNYENVVVTDDVSLIRSFSDEFERLWEALPDFHG